MGIDVSGHGRSASFHSLDWPCLIDLAKEFGWQPEGTQPPHYWKEPTAWDGSNYFTSDYQEVTASDAAAMGAALFRASTSRRSAVMTEKQRELFNGMPLSAIEELADLASGGKFYIG